MPIKYAKWLVSACISNQSNGNGLHPSARYPQGHVKQILVLEHGSNPTTDYYIKPRIQNSSVPAILVDISQHRPDHFKIEQGTFVIIVRYLNRSWGNHLARHRQLLQGAAFFMDDDLPAACNATHLPLRYRHKIHSLFERQLDQLNYLCSEVWVSTQSLAETYAHCTPQVVGPLPCTAQNMTKPARLTYFYHGSASHQPEIKWLYDVVARVQSRSEMLDFMIVGGSDVNRLFKSLPRVIILHPLSWETYCNSLAALPHHIGLAPLLPNSFNKGRSHTKFFDLTRLGSVGIYSDTPPYNHFVRHEIDGILLKNDPALWADAIIRLAENNSRRTQILDQARMRVEKLVHSHPNLPPSTTGISMVSAPSAHYSMKSQGAHNSD